MFIQYCLGVRWLTEDHTRFGPTVWIYHMVVYILEGDPHQPLTLSAPRYLHTEHIHCVGFLWNVLLQVVIDRTPVIEPDILVSCLG